MPKKKKLKLEDLKVTSFITGEESKSAKGGAASDATNCFANPFCFESGTCPDDTTATTVGTTGDTTIPSTIIESCANPLACQPNLTIGTDAYHQCIEPVCN